MIALRGDSCSAKKSLLSIYLALACIDFVVAVVSFFQFMRIQMRNIQQRGLTRQKVFHILIGSSNMGCFAYFLLIASRTCKRWLRWSQFYGFIIMVSPKILLLAVFALLLSFWADLCHHANDEDEEYSLDNTLLEKTPNVSNPLRKKCLECWEFSSFRSSQIRSRQRNVIFFILVIFILMMASASLIWIESNINPTLSFVVAKVYVDILAVINLVVAAGLACYGVLLFSKFKRIVSETSCEMWKVAGVAAVSVTCLASSSLVALLTDIPLLHDLGERDRSESLTSVLLILYHFMGSSLPSAFILWVMKESPSSPPIVPSKGVEEKTVAFIHGASSSPGSDVVHHQTHRWTSTTASQNQVSRGSPI